MAEKKKRSRRKETDNSQQPVASVTVPTAHLACPKCGSTERGKITSTKRRDLAGTFNGQIYDYQIRKWTSCSSCGQRRVLIEHHRK